MVKGHERQRWRRPTIYSHHILTYAHTKPNAPTHFCVHQVCDSEEIWNTRHLPQMLHMPHMPHIFIVVDLKNRNENTSRSKSIDEEEGRSSVSFYRNSLANYVPIWCCWRMCSIFPPHHTRYWLTLRTLLSIIASLGLGHAINRNTWKKTTKLTLWVAVWPSFDCCTLHGANWSRRRFLCTADMLIDSTWLGHRGSSVQVVRWN